VILVAGLPRTDLQLIQMVVETMKFQERRPLNISLVKVFITICQSTIQFKQLNRKDQWMVEPAGQRSAFTQMEQHQEEFMLMT